LAEPERISLEVYGLDGARVRTLMEGQMNVRLKAGPRRLTSKLVKIR
jgi:hypothetical protein